MAYRKVYRGRRPKKMRRMNRRMAKKVGRTITSKLNQTNGIHYFKRTFSGSNLTGLNAPVLAVSAFKLSDLPNYAEYQNLFTLYRIRGVQIKFYLLTDPSAQTAANSITPKLYWKKDYVNTIAPTTLAALKENSNTKVRSFSPNRPITVYIKPASTEYDITATGVVSSYGAPQWGKSYNVLDSEIRHLGLQWAIDYLPSTQVIGTDLTYYLELRQPK